MLEDTLLQASCTVIIFSPQKLLISGKLILWLSVAEPQSVHVCLQAHMSCSVSPRWHLLWCISVSSNPLMEEPLKGSDEPFRCERRKVITALMFSAVIKSESSTTNTVELYVVHPVSHLDVIWLPLHIIINLIVPILFYFYYYYYYH